MCGIVGFLNAKRDEPANSLTTDLTQMMGQIRHRGPDDSHTWVSAEQGVALGFRRLAILDLSINGRQPMFSADERYAIVYNGEVYNYQELQEELQAKGYRFKGGSDTEIMLAAIQEWGLTSAVGKFNGMFAFALWDRQTEQLHLVRDRLGIKPLYCGWQSNHFYFASELKALRRHRAFNPKIDDHAVAAYSRFGYIPSPQSIYQTIRKLPPASILTVSPHKPGEVENMKTYWQAPNGTISSSGAEYAQDEVLEQLEVLLKESVRLRMLADVPLGAFLSGGIDSSLIVALMQVQSSKPVKTFTIGFHEDEYNEAIYAKKVASSLGTDHTELYLTAEDALQVIPKLPYIYDEPFADSSQIPTYLVSALARQHVTVALSGDGGDELFMGYNRYFWANRIWQATRLLPSFARHTLAGGLMKFSPDRWNRLGTFLPAGFRYRQIGDKINKLASILGRQGPQSIYSSLITYWPSAVSLRAKADDLPQPLELSNGHSAAFMEWMSAMDLRSYLPDDILVKVDRASMAVSLEARAPFLDDHRVVEFAMALPALVRVKNNQGKWLLRQLLAKYIPIELFDRPKMGFGVPIDSWLRGPLRPWAESLLAPKRLQAEGYFDVQAIRQKWEQHLNGTQNWQYHLWVILMFQAWLDASTAA